MSGYVYGEKEPTAECGCCGGPAYAEFCDVGVGMVQIEPYHCSVCGAAESVPDGKGGWIHEWTMPAKPSERGESVTGYLINERGTVFETTFDDGHAELYARMRTNWSALRARGCVRITNLEGFAIDMPPFMTRPTRRALARTLKEIGGEVATVDGRRRDWGLPYVSQAGAEFWREMTMAELMATVAGLAYESAESSFQPATMASDTLEADLLF